MFSKMTQSMAKQKSYRNIKPNLLKLFRAIASFQTCFELDLYKVRVHKAERDQAFILHFFKLEKLVNFFFQVTLNFFFK